MKHLVLLLLFALTLTGVQIGGKVMVKDCEQLTNWPAGDAPQHTKAPG